jgi:hypothetical protein
MRTLFALVIGVVAGTAAALWIEARRTLGAPAAPRPSAPPETQPQPALAPAGDQEEASDDE